MSKKSFTTLGREEVPFDVDGVDYVIRQASSLAGTVYREASLKNAEMEFTGEDADAKRIMRKIQGVAGLEPLLVSLCTFEAKSNVLVTRELVDGWLGEITKWAFGEVKRISPWLDEKDDDLDGLKRQRDRLNDRIAKLESADPKASPSVTTASS